MELLKQVKNWWISKFTGVDISDIEAIGRFHLTELAFDALYTPKPNITLEEYDLYQDYFWELRKGIFIHKLKTRLKILWKD